MRSRWRICRSTERVAILAAGLVWLAAAPALAQSPAPAGAGTSRCVDAKVGSAESYGCLNQQLQQQALQQHGAPPNTGTVTATSPAPASGTYNQAAVREHLGTSFGHSSIPQRPPPVVYPSPLVR